VAIITLCQEKIDIVLPFSFYLKTLTEDFVCRRMSMQGTNNIYTIQLESLNAPPVEE